MIAYLFAKVEPGSPVAIFIGITALLAIGCHTWAAWIRANR